MTDVEKQLWACLRARRFTDFKFRRQAPIGRYIADFACFEALLVVELDGSQHYQSPRDSARDADLSSRGFEVLRVWNSEFTDNRDGVLDGIFAALVRRTGRDTERAASPSSGLRPPSPTRGEGDDASNLSVGPSPLMGEGGRRADEGGAADSEPGGSSP